MSSSVMRLAEIVRTLREPGGCPWDREQTHETLRSALLEECHEAIDAINRADDANLREELGDLLLLVVMHAQIAMERDAFCLEEIAEAVCEKMIRRHPHVFGSAKAENSHAVLRQWDQIKRSEKGAATSVIDGITTSLPALMEAQTIQKKAARVGFDWENFQGPLAKVEEELAELKSEIPANHSSRLEEELGDLLFSVVNLARKLGLDAETALAGANKKFVRRFSQMEKQILEEGKNVEELGLEEMDRYWERGKAGESSE